MASTISTLSQLFHSMFPINSQDDNSGVPGILLGRYEGDTYGGTSVLPSQSSTRDRLLWAPPPVSSHGCPLLPPPPLPFSF